MPDILAFSSGTLRDQSGSIATGGTAQQLMPANGRRRGFSVYNLSSADLWINELGAAAVAGQPSLKITAGTYYETPASGVGVQAVSILGATAGQQFTAREW